MHLSTSLGLTQPVLQFRVRVGCGSSFERSYVVLSEPPETPVAVSLPRVDTALREEVDTPPVLPKGMPSAGLPSTSGQPGIVLASSTSLRMLSRQRYPGDSRARVRFIRQLAAANPELFASEEAAFDQRLAAGTRLLMPPGLPVLPRAGSVAARAPGSGATRSAPAAPLAVGKPGKATGAGRGRLIVGSAGLSAAPGPSTAELNESIDRLVEVMNQQVLVQIAMTERVKAVEAELAELKRQVAAERVRTAKLEADLKAEREAVERSGTIQLLLAILLGGLAGAWTLSWISRRKESAAVIPLAAVSPAPTPESVQAAPPMPSVFEDMPDEREEILPPAGLRF